MLNIVLYQPEKPANTGNIIRTAMALNATVHIIKPISFYTGTINKNGHRFTVAGKEQKKIRLLFHQE